MVRRLILKERLDSAAAEDLRDELETVVDEDVVLEASAVTVLGGLCLELLMGARQVWSAAGREFSVENPSLAFEENLVRLGLSAEQLNAGGAA